MTSSLGLAGAVGAGAVQVARPIGATAVQAHAKTMTVAFSGSYKGTMALLWSSSAVTVTSVTGTGASSKLGTATLKGTGASSPSSTCDPFSGSGTISSAKGKLIFKVVSSSKQQACATGSAAPTSVTVKGVATVTNGTGVYARAKGTLTLKGTFSIQSTTAGSSETDSFTASLTGRLTVTG
ncbi:MAG: hypothetical protein WCA31_01690 [Acidimicrobiales bacterium]